MRAAILHKAGGTPEVGEFDDPGGDDVVEVRLAGLNPVDLAMASGGMGEPTTPSIVGQEGVGTRRDGQRVYFNSPPDPFGSWAERSPIDPERTFPIPDGVDDELAVALGIPGLAAWIPLTRHARLQDGEQRPRARGDGRRRPGGRPSRQAPRRRRDRGAVRGDDAEALKGAAGGDFAVVIDTIYDDPFVAALDATANGARLVTLGALRITRVEQVHKHGIKAPERRVALPYRPPPGNAWTRAGPAPGSTLLVWPAPAARRSATSQSARRLRCCGRRLSRVTGPTSRRWRAVPAYRARLRCG